MQAHSKPSALALITGASSGIGQQIAQRLAQAGYHIVVDHFRDPDGAEQTLELVRQAGSQGWAFDADVGSSQELDRLFAKIAEADLPLEVLVNNAAVQTFAPLLELREEDWNRTLRTNLSGTFLCTQRAARLMRSDAASSSPSSPQARPLQGGAIINIGSGANRVPFPSLGDYAASKGGIEMLTKVAAIELGRFGIRVNCVAPGAIENERTRRESPDYAQTWGAITPLGRVGTQSDVADTVAYLVSPAASFVTGQTLYVDGGLWTRGVWPYEV